MYIMGTAGEVVEKLIYALLVKF